MNICKWCNAKVADENTVWYRRNLLLGYSFCSTRCATYWKQSNNTSIERINDNSPENNSKSIVELAYDQQQKKMLQEKHDKENIEAAIRIMALIRKVMPYWKIIIASSLIILATIFYLNPIYGQIMIYIYILFIAGIIWAYLTEPKNE